MFKRWLLRLFCRHDVWEAPKLTVLPEVSRKPFKVKCRRFKRGQKAKEGAISGLDIHIQKPFHLFKGNMK